MLNQDAHITHIDQDHSHNSTYMYMHAVFTCACSVPPLPCSPQDAHGNTLDMSSATASSGVTPNRALPSTTSTSTAAAASQPHETTPTPPAPPPSSSSSSSSSSREAEQLRRRQQEEERVDMERDRAARQLKNVQTHVKTTRRCLHFASKVLERYEVSALHKHVYSRG